MPRHATEPFVQDITGVTEAANTAARLGLTGLTKGQVVHQLDENRLYTYLGPDPSDAGDWIGGAKPSELLEHQILPQFTSAYYTGGTVLTNYAADASGINRSNLKAVWGGRVATSIGNGVFDYCGTLTSADFPLVTSIGSYAFNYCESLASADFPLVTSIGDYAFYRCTPLTSVDFPLVTSIGSYAFGLCISLTSVDFPLATTIGDEAFGGCTSLTSVDFPLATTIGSYAFFNCDSLASADFPLVTSIEDAAFAQCSDLASADFPLVTSIGNYVFTDCNSLASADFPLVTSIGSGAFNGCSLLTDLYLIAPLSGLDEIALGSEWGNSSVTTIHLRPAPDTPAGWTEGVHTIAGKTGVTVVFDWTTYPNRP